MDIYKEFGATRFDGNLKNGIKVVLFHRVGAPVTTYTILKSGSRYDPPSMPGTAHFIEHMIVNGSLEFPSKDLLAEHIESVGGGYSAKTSQDPMWIITEVSDESDYSRVVDILKATLCVPLMDDKVFENEKQVVIKEIQRNNSNPGSVLTKTVRSLFFEGTPFEHNVIGNEESISSLKHSDILTEHAKLFDKSRITFIVSGDILIDKLIKHLDKLPFLDNNLNLEVDDNYLISQKKILSILFDAPQTYLHFGVPAPKMFTRDWSDLILLANILAGGRASRLAKRLRYKAGLVYSVGFTRNGGLNFGSWGISTDTTTEKVQLVVDEIIKEIKDIQDNGIKESELEFVKNRNLKSLRRSMQTSDQWVDFHALSVAFSPVSYDLNSYIKNTQESTTNSIKKVIDKYLKNDNWKLALCGRTREEEVKISW